MGGKEGERQGKRKEWKSADDHESGSEYVECETTRDVQNVLEMQC